MFPTEAKDSQFASAMQPHQYSEWQIWSSSNRQLASSDLIAEDVKSEEERHMYLPLKRPSFIAPQFCNLLGDNEMVARVVAFFQAVQTNTAIRQLQQQEQEYFFQPLSLDCENDTASHVNCEHVAHYPQHEQIPQQQEQQQQQEPDYSFLTELGGETPSRVMAEQAALWDRLKKDCLKKVQATSIRTDTTVVPRIPEWLHQAARDEGRQIRVMTVDGQTPTDSIVCVGCHKNIMVAQGTELVYCPCCGTTFPIESANELMGE